MRDHFPRSPILLLLVGAVMALGCQRPADEGPQAPTSHEEPAAHHAEAPPVGQPLPPIPSNPPRNAVQAEMRLLLDATRDWVTAIAQHDLAAIPPAISRVHAARLVTDAELKAGTYAPPKGGAAARESFIRQDEAFHDELVALLQAAKANDLPAATRQLGVVLDGCTRCHMTYRF